MNNWKYSMILGCEIILWNIVQIVVLSSNKLQIFAEFVKKVRILIFI